MVLRLGVATTTQATQEEDTLLTVGGRRVEEEWQVQARRIAQHEVEEEACDESSQGGEPLHQRAMCLHDQASQQDRAYARS